MSVVALGRVDLPLGAAQLHHFYSVGAGRCGPDVRRCLLHEQSVPARVTCVLNIAKRKGGEGGHWGDAHPDKGRLGALGSFALLAELIWQLSDIHDDDKLRWGRTLAMIAPSVLNM